MLCTQCKTSSNSTYKSITKRKKIVISKYLNHLSFPSIWNNLYLIDWFDFCMPILCVVHARSRAHKNHSHSTAQIRIFKTREIKRRTRRKYQKLPEILKRQQLERDMKIRRNHRILVNTFSKVCATAVFYWKSLNELNSVIRS